MKSKKTVPCLEELNQIAKIPWSVWNSIVIQNSSEGASAYLATLKKLIEDLPTEIHDMIDYLRHRKVHCLVSMITWSVKRSSIKTIKQVRSNFLPKHGECLPS